jgi:ParB-like chromosome segregation protein Spo0J
VPKAPPPARVLEQTYELVPLDTLTVHPDNPRRGDLAQIASSIEANGFYGAVVAQRSTGRILAGNHRWMAAREDGLDAVPVIWLDVDDDRARRILLADNRAGDLAAYDEAALLALLDEMALTPELLAGSGYDVDDLDDLRAALDDVTTLPPLPTGAAYAETAEQEAERAGRYGTEPSIHAAGLREVIFVYSLEDHADVIARIAALRAGRPDVTSSQVVHEALRAAAPVTA